MALKSSAAETQQLVSTVLDLTILDVFNYLIIEPDWISFVTFNQKFIKGSNKIKLFCLEPLRSIKG
jgi:hypothetical protein